MTTERTVRVVGLGSPHGEDDAGWQVVRAIAAFAPQEWTTELLRTPIDLVATLSADRPLVLVDAAAEPLPDSPLWRFRWPELPTDAFDIVSTHAFDLRYALELAGSLQLLPELVLVYAVHVGGTPAATAETSYDRTPSDIVQTIARCLVRDLRRCLAEPASTRSGPVPVAGQ